MILGTNDILRLYGSAKRLQPIEQDDFTTSYLGTPIYDQLVILKEDNPEIEISTGFALTEMIMQVNRPKNIIRTSMQGRTGDVNELISNGDYDISINGFLVSQDQLKQPSDQLEIFTTIMDYQGSIAVASDYLNLLGVDTIVVDSYSVGQIEGTRNMLAYTIQCRSENPIELQIQSSNNANS